MRGGVRRVPARTTGHGTATAEEGCGARPARRRGATSAESRSANERSRNTSPSATNARLAPACSAKCQFGPAWTAASGRRARGERQPSRTTTAPASSIAVSMSVLPQTRIGQAARSARFPERIGRGVSGPESARRSARSAAAPRRPRDSSHTAERAPSRSVPAGTPAPSRARLAAVRSSAREMCTRSGPFIWRGCRRR